MSAARRISKSSVDWATFYQKVPARERELYRALKNRSDYFVNKVHSNPESLGKINFAHYRTMLPGLKMVDEFEQAYAKVSVPYATDKNQLGDKIKQEEATVLSASAQEVKRLEGEKVLSAEFLKKLDELPKQEEFTIEMMNDYFPWTQVKGENPKLFPFTKEYQPENLTLNDSRGWNNLLARFGLGPNAKRATA